MFNKTKYTKWYNAIIENAKCREVKGYIERHHIIPISMGGSNTKDNLVKLTAREHFIVHLLLTKMCLDKSHECKMKYALHRFMFSKKEHRKLTSRQFELARLIYSNKDIPDDIRKKLSERHKGKPKNYVTKGFESGHIPWNKGLRNIIKLSDKEKEVRSRRFKDYAKSLGVENISQTEVVRKKKSEIMKKKYAEGYINPMKLKKLKQVEEV